MPPADLTVYDAGSRRDGLRVWPEMMREVAASKDLIWFLFARDLKGHYRQTLLGHASALAPPLIATALLTFVAHRRLLPLGGAELPYPLFALLGLTVWGLFSGSVTAVTSSISTAANLVKKMNFPREAVIFAALGRPLSETAIRLIPLAVLLIWYGVPLQWTAVLVPLALVPLLLLAVGIGLPLVVINALARDAGTAVGIALQLGMFLTPVVYPPPTTWPYTLINHLNPVAPFVAAVRELLLVGDLTMPGPLLSSSVAGCLVFLLGWRVFRLAQPILGERL